MAMEKAQAWAKNYLAVFNSGQLTGDKAGSFYTRDARYMAPGQSAFVGRANVVKGFEGYIARCGYADIDNVEMFFDDAHEAGEFLITAGRHKISSKGKVLEAGKFAVIFKKEDGEYKIYYDIFNLPS